MKTNMKNKSEVIDLAENYSGPKNIIVDFIFGFLKWCKCLEKNQIFEIDQRMKKSERNKIIRENERMLNKNDKDLFGATVKSLQKSEENSYLETNVDEPIDKKTKTENYEILKDKNQISPYDICSFESFEESSPKEEEYKKNDEFKKESEEEYEILTKS